MKTQISFWMQAKQVELKEIGNAPFGKVLAHSERYLSVVQRKLEDWLGEDVSQKNSVSIALSFNLSDAEMGALMNDPSLDD